MRMVLLIFSVAAAIGQETPRLCAVTLRVVDIAGRPLPYRVESFKSRDGVQFAESFDGLRGKVPCDVLPYQVRVNRIVVTDRMAPITRVEETLVVWNPENWKTISTHPSLRVSEDGSRGGIDAKALPPGYVWRGRVVSPFSERLWVHFRSVVRSVYVGADVEGEVDENGEFRVYGLLFEGPYSLYVVNEKGELRHSALVTVEAELPGNPFVLSLSEQNPTAIGIR
jgi:hypothetical protein